MLKLNHFQPKLVVTILFCGLCILSFLTLKSFAKEGEVKDTKKSKTINSKITLLLNGFTIGTDSRIFPYAALEDWFDPYGGLKLEHRAFWNSSDKMFHHFKFEGPRDYSWKFRYLANSISTQNTKFSLLFKRKIDRDPFFYGIGNSTSKSQRASAKYASIFFGGEIEQNISNTLVFRFSPGSGNLHLV